MNLSKCLRGLLACVLLASEPACGDPIDVGQVLGFTPGIHGAVELVFPSETGKYYQVQISADMATWDNEGYSVKGTGGQISVLARTRNLASAFYRLRDDGSPDNVAPVGPAGPQGEAGADAEGFAEGLSVQGENHLVNSQAFSAKKTASWLSGNIGGSPPLRGLQFGDSLASGLALGANMARAGVIGLGMTNMSGSVLQHGTGSAPFRFDYWINGQATEFAVGSSAEFVEGSRANGDLRGTEACIAFLVRPEGGTFDLEYQKNGAGSWVKLATIATNGPTTSGAFRTYPLSGSRSPFYRLRVANVTQASCIVLFSGIYQTDGGGVIWMPVGAQGGIDVSQSVTTPSAILDPVWSALAPDFVLTCWADAAAEWEPGGAFRAFYDRVRARRAATDWILISANPALDETGRPEQRVAQKQWAEEAGQTWINGHAMFRDYSTANDRGLMHDAVHLSASGQAVRNMHLWSSVPLGQVSLGGVLSDGPSAPVVGLIPSGPAANSPIEFTRPIQIRGGTGGITFYDRTRLLDGDRVWSLYNEGNELKAHHAGGHALVLGSSVDLGVHPGSDSLRLGRENRRWRGWFSGVQTGIVTKTEDYAATIHDHTILCDAKAGRVVVSLPNADSTNQGRIYTVKKIDATRNRVILDPAGDQTIDGKISYAIATKMAFVEVQSNGSAWFVIGR